MGSKIDAVRKKIWLPRNDVDAPSKGILCNWVRQDDHDLSDSKAPLVDMERYRELLTHLPDRVVENLEKARLERAGIGPMLKAGMGYVDLLGSVVVDGTAIASSSTEAFLFPAYVAQKNYFAPGGLPGKSIRWRARGRGTTLVTTAGTMTMKFGSALTNVIPTTTWAVNGGIAAHATAQTATQWKSEGDAVVRSVGAGGTVFCEGDIDLAWSDLTTAAQQAKFMGSAGNATPSTAALDTTADQYISLTGKWSLATAYSIQGHIYTLEALN